MEKVLLDTDVILDFFFDRKPFADHAAGVLHLCKENKIEGHTTPVIISNVYYLLRKVAKHEAVVDKLNQLLSFIDIVSMNRTVVINALNSEFKDFEDALQHFSATETNNINVILTRNIKDFKKSNLAVLTPETYLKGKTRG
ncbi:type II toxin-antitoxin system VapC family toxin [Flagellimonas sp.]|uniref:type II toxin-antitoxin system VapC family toxin n=1 Tax=Flagellimonas sp. TaxID=2058762 RepID=UPI003B50DBE2